MLVILGDSPERAASYGVALHIPFPILADPTEVVYHRFGLHKALLLIQRTASVIVDRNGAIRYLKRATNPGTWLRESQELVRVIQEMGR